MRLKKIAFHWSKNFEYYNYHNNIILRSLNKRSTELKVTNNNGIYEIRVHMGNEKYI